jgi:anaerobic magnesium-protoporphyrin IX monomethyl ester cyclase
MNICLIKPPILHKGISFARMATPPLGLAYIAAALKKAEHNVSVIDASALGIKQVQHYSNDIYLFGLNKHQIAELVPPNSQVIGLTLMFTNNWLYDRELIAYLKQQFPQAILVVGGEHATAAYELCFSQSAIDFLVRGEGEDTIVELMEALELKKPVSEVNGIVFKSEGKLEITASRNRNRKLDSITWPAWELFQLDNYFDHKISFGVYRGRTLPVIATRGCPYECTFCSNPQMWGRLYQMRSPIDFVNELEHFQKLYNIQNFDLYDLTAIVKKEWIVSMCKEIVARNLQITYQLPSGTRSEAIDYEVAQWLYKSGCKNISYAPESGSEIVLKQIKKKVSISNMLQSIKYSYKAGLNVKLNMIMGFPDDTHRDIWSSFWFLIKASWYGANDAAPAIFSPYPGSELYDKLVKDGELDIYNDSFLFENIDTYDLFPARVYSRNISSSVIRAYILVFLFIFYGSNYVFRPWRLFRTLYNLAINRHESRTEQLIYHNFLKNIFVIPDLIRRRVRKFLNPASPV